MSMQSMIRIYGIVFIILLLGSAFSMPVKADLLPETGGRPFSTMYGALCDVGSLSTESMYTTGDPSSNKTVAFKFTGFIKLQNCKGRDSFTGHLMSAYYGANLPKADTAFFKHANDNMFKYALYAMEKDHKVFVRYEELSGDNSCIYVVHSIELLK
ncbi:MAG: hypothetical protein AABY86_00500 [Bdellovibrionota bacterium]